MDVVLKAVPPRLVTLLSRVS